MIYVVLKSQRELERINNAVFFPTQWMGLFRGGSTGGKGGRSLPNEKCGPQSVLPHFAPASLDFHLNRPVISLIQLQNTVISLIQLHIVPQLELWSPPLASHLASVRTAPGAIYNAVSFGQQNAVHCWLAAVQDHRFFVT